jgi:hypothetical protein
MNWPPFLCMYPTGLFQSGMSDQIDKQVEEELQHQKDGKPSFGYWSDISGYRQRNSGSSERWAGPLPSACISRGCPKVGCQTKSMNRWRKNSNIRKMENPALSSTCTLCLLGKRIRLRERVGCRWFVYVVNSVVCVVRDSWCEYFTSLSTFSAVFWQKGFRRRSVIEPLSAVGGRLVHVVGAQR